MTGEMRQRQALDRQLADFEAAIGDLEGACGAVATETGLRRAASRRDAETLLRLLEQVAERPDIPSAWLTKGTLELAGAAIERVASL